MKPKIKEKKPAKNEQKRRSGGKHIHLVVREKPAQETTVSSAHKIHGNRAQDTQAGSVLSAHRTSSNRAQEKQDHRAIAARIADDLGETKTWPRAQIHHVVWAIGPGAALQFVQRAREIEGAGGMIIPSGTRRRTLGGIFFHLVYTEGTALPGKELRRSWTPKPRPAAADQDETGKTNQ